MFEGITWGQFCLFVLGAVIIYYIIVIAIYYRSEVLAVFSKNKKTSDLVPAPVPAFSAVGSTFDYGNSMTNVSAPNTPDLNNSTNSDSTNSDSINSDNESGEDPDNGVGEGFEIQDQEDEEENQEEAYPAGEGFAEEAYLLFEDEVDLEEQFTSFDEADALEVETGGISVNELSRTVELLNQDEMTMSEKGELSKNLELIDDTHLLQSLLSGNSRVKEKLNLILGDRLSEAEEEEPVKGEQVIKDSFADVDVTKLIKQKNNF